MAEPLPETVIEERDRLKVEVERLRAAVKTAEDGWERDVERLRAALVEAQRPSGERPSGRELARRAQEAAGYWDDTVRDLEAERDTARAERDRYRLAWQSARRGRVRAREEARFLRRAALRDRLAANGAIDRIERLAGERDQAEADVERAQAERDRLAEQVRVLTETLKRTGTKARCSGHPDHADPDCETCRDAEIFRAALDGETGGRS